MSEDVVAVLKQELAELRVLVAALTPWADLGRVAVDRAWWWRACEETEVCLYCHRQLDPGFGWHAADCVVPALLDLMIAEQAAANV
jgi:hypothetical protein